MFDIGFWELALIGVIALLVVGPERLPALARTVGLWVGRARRYVSHVQADIEREINAEEVRKLIDTPSQSISEINQVLNGTKKIFDEAGQEIEDLSMEADHQSSELEAQIDGALDVAEAGLAETDSEVDSAANPFASENAQLLSPSSEHAHTSTNSTAAVNEADAPSGPDEDQRHVQP